MFEAIAEGVSFVECFYEWGRRTGKRATLEMAKTEGRSYDFVLLK
jgi:hypothetical protein